MRNDTCQNITRILTLSLCCQHLAFSSLDCEPVKAAPDNSALKSPPIKRKISEASCLSANSIFAPAIKDTRQLDEGSSTNEGNKMNEDRSLNEATKKIRIEEISSDLATLGKSREPKPENTVAVKEATRPEHDTLEESREPKPENTVAVKEATRPEYDTLGEKYRAGMFWNEAELRSEASKANVPICDYSMLDYMECLSELVGQGEVALNQRYDEKLFDRPIEANPEMPKSVGLFRESQLKKEELAKQEAKIRAQLIEVGDEMIAILKQMITLLEKK